MARLDESITAGQVAHLTDHDKLHTKANYVYDVTDFGTIGDGVADDSTAIQAAIDAADAASPKGKLFFPSGQYLCNTGLVLPGLTAHLVGGGGQGISEDPPEGASLIAGTNGMTLLHVDSPSSVLQPGPIFEYLNFIDESAAKTAILVHFHNVNRWTFRNCSFRGANGTGGVGLKLTREPSGGDNSWNMIDHCHFQQVDTGILAEESNFTMVGSDIDAITWAMNVDEDSADVKIFGGKAVGQGYLIEGQQCTIQGVAFEDCDPAIRINDTGSGVRGRRNSIIGCGITATATDIGIDLAGTDPSENQLIGNTFSGINAVNQISYGGSRNVIVGSNVLVLEVDGALALDWQHSILNVTSYTGTRAITLPDNVLYDGQHYLVRREGTNNVTVTCVGSDVWDDGSNTIQTLATADAFIDFFSIGDTQWKIIDTGGTVTGS